MFSLQARAVYTEFWLIIPETIIETKIFWLSEIGVKTRGLLSLGI